MPPLEPAAPPRRRPEHFAAAQHRAYVLQRSIPAVRARGGGAVARDRARHDAPFRGYDQRVQIDLLAALDRAIDETAQARLLDGLARRDVEDSLVRDVLRVLRGQPFDADRAERALGWLTRPAFAALAPHVRRDALAADLRLVEDGGYRRALEAMLRAPGFLALESSRQSDLLRFLAGPRAAEGAAPLRAQWLAAAWGSRRSALGVALRRPAFKRARPTLQAEMLQDFLQEEAVEVWALHATALSGHATIVLGDPRNQKAIAYGRRWVRTETGHARRLTCMPDPTIRHGWQRPAVDAVTRYAGAAYRLTRLGELHLVEGLEQLGGLDGDRPSGRGLPPKDLVTAAEDALRFLSSHPPRHATLIAGQPIQQESEANDDSLAMLQAYLSA